LLIWLVAAAEMAEVGETPNSFWACPAPPAAVVFLVVGAIVEVVEIFFRGGEEKNKTNINLT
jgi:hypothetical protein